MGVFRYDTVRPTREFSDMLQYVDVERCSSTAMIRYIECGSPLLWYSTSNTRVLPLWYGTSNRGVLLLWYGTSNVGVLPLWYGTSNRGVLCYDTVHRMWEFSDMIQYVQHGSSTAMIRYIQHGSSTAMIQYVQHGSSNAMIQYIECGSSLLWYSTSNRGVLPLWYGTSNMGVLCYDTVRLFCSCSNSCSLYHVSKLRCLSSSKVFFKGVRLKNFFTIDLFVKFD